MPPLTQFLQECLLAMSGASMVPGLMAALQSGEVAALLGGFFQEGFLHIIPHGLDHVLFVLGLFFLCREFGSFLGQVATFTIAHSLTFGLGMLGLVRAPAGIVEPLIVLSIAFVAVENLFATKAGNRRQIAVFLFGLVHGLGFAAAFQGAGAGANAEVLPIALLALNAGMGTGHLVVVAGAYLAFSSFWKQAWYRKAVAVPASCAIAVVSLTWAVARVAG